MCIPLKLVTCTIIQLLTTRSFICPPQVTSTADASSYTAGSREAALHALAGRCAHIVPLLDAFEHRTAAGRHACMVLERQGSPLEYVSGV
jgi:hypothetical protein